MLLAVFFFLFLVYTPSIKTPTKNSRANEITISESKVTNLLGVTADRTVNQWLSRRHYMMYCTFPDDILAYVHSRTLAYTCIHARKSYIDTHARLASLSSTSFYTIYEQPLNARFSGLVSRLVFIVEERTISAARLLFTPDANCAKKSSNILFHPPNIVE